MQMDQQLINRIVEAALLAANQPLTLAQLHALFPEEQPAPADSVEKALETLREQSAERGVELVEVASGFRYQVQADVHSWVARLWTERQTKYTRATLETLALIAYRQPITRGEIEQIRGVTVNSNIIKALEEREWIRVVGHRDMPGRPELLGTSKGFLDYFGLKRLDELPPLSELKDFGELEPQLKFDSDALPVGDVAVDAANVGAGIDGAGADGEIAAETDSHDLDAEAKSEGGIDDDHERHTARVDDDDAHPDHPESQDESNDPALADDGDSTRSI
jgi:segregation and condensation protein B